MTHTWGESDKCFKFPVTMSFTQHKALTQDEKHGWRRERSHKRGWKNWEVWFVRMKSLPLPPLIPVTSNHAFPIVSYKKNFHLNGGRSACEWWKICGNIDAWIIYKEVLSNTKEYPFKYTVHREWGERRETVSSLGTSMFRNGISLKQWKQWN
jgi:hypothetical protein